MAQYRYNFPTTIHFGAGTRFMVRDHFKQQGLKRPLVVTDKGVAGLSFFKDFISKLEMESSVFADIAGNPVKSQVMKGVDAYRVHRADSIIGIGGGAALDVAKAIALMVNHPGDLFDYEDDLPGARPVNQPIPYFVALPTTSGTGSEVGRSAVVSDDVTHVKKIIFDPKLLAKVVYADPETTLELPAKITAAVGFDALTHNVEAFLAKGFHPICDGIALEGIRLASIALEKAVKNPSDMEARGQMMMSSMMGAIAFQKGLGLVHSCAHSLSAVTDMHHGLANAIMIDHALLYNVSAVPERFTRMAQVIGLKDTSPEGFLKWLTDLKGIVGIPAKLSQAGVKKDQLGALVEGAVKDVCHGSGPRACTKETFVEVFNRAL